MTAPAFYVYLQYKLNEHTTNGKIYLEEALTLLSKYNIPKKMRLIVIKEMEAMNLVSIMKIPKQTTVKVKNCNIDNEYALIGRLTRRKKYVEEIVG